MKLICQREKMLAAFQTAASVAPTRSPMPILQNIKLEARKDGVELMATDTELGIRIQVAEVEVETPGAIVLPVARFGSILRESSDQTLRLEGTAEAAFVRGDRSEFRLAAQRADEFPAVPTFADTKYYEVPARLLKEMIRRTIFAIDQESGRYALGGILLDFGEKVLTAVGTDGRRLAKMEGPLMAVGGVQPSESMTIVPARAMQLLERALSDSDAEIQLAAHNNEILVKSPRMTIYSRLVEGRFPRWRDVLPKNRGSINLEIPAGTVYSAIRQAAIVASDETKGIDFAFEKGQLTLRGSTAEVGEASVRVPLSYEGSDLRIALNHRFVTDLLKVVPETQNIQLDLTDSDSPAVFSIDSSYVYIVMPLNRERQP